MENTIARPYIITCSSRSWAVFVPDTPKEMSSMSEHEDKFANNDGHDLAVEEARPKIKQPPLYRVVLINDDYTPMEFVVEVLVYVFQKSPEDATRIMLNVHRKGVGICGIYPFEVAETKVNTVETLARENGFPLKCVMERE